MSNRVPNKSQIGHLTLKSSAYAPTAMSHMGQDLIMNHMQCHYRRILSAKASVDTSPPKSMKMHMRVRDQKKRESLNRREMGLLSARSNTSNASQQFTGQRLSSRSSSVDNLASSRHARGSPRDEQKLRCSTPLDSSKRPQSAQMDHRFHSSQLTDYNSPRQNDRELIRDTPTEEKPHGLYQQESSKLLVADSDWDKRQPRSPRNSDPYVTSLGRDEGRDPMRASKLDSTTDRHRPLHQKGIKHGQGHESSLDNYNFTLDLQQFSDEDLNDNVGNTSKRKVPSGLKNSQLYEGADLDPEELSFSYKGPPSSRREPKTVNIWEEEQLYLRFISDVTTDILARGVFSNRVLQQVFDSHIKRRKHQLDEERMQEMIDQLKEDLSITDFPSQS